MQIPFLKLTAMTAHLRDVYLQTNLEVVGTWEEFLNKKEQNINKGNVYLGMQRKNGTSWPR